MEQVARHVWVVTSPTWLTTSTLVVDDDGACLLVDPALTPEEILALEQEVSRRGWHVAAGFSTHPHWDHVLWSAALPDVPRWATSVATDAATAEELTAQASRDLPGYRWDVIGGTTPLAPDTTEVPWTGPRAVVVPTPGHAPGHASLHLPEEGVLIAGDMLSDVEVPLLDDAPDALEEYRHSLRRLADLDPRVVVPGHGRVAHRWAGHRRVHADERYLADLAAGTPPHDHRLADPRVRADHESQSALLSSRAGG